MDFNEIDRLENFFKTVTERNLIASKYATITDLKLFVSTHISICRQNPNKQWFDIYLRRLKSVEKILIKNKLKNICS